MVARSRPASSGSAPCGAASRLICLVRVWTNGLAQADTRTDTVYSSGYDGSVLNAAFGIDDFLSDMNDPDSNKQGLLSAAISLGYLIGFFPSSWAGDKWGRKWPQLVGSAIVVGACFMQVFAISGWKCKPRRPIMTLRIGLTHSHGNSLWRKDPDRVRRSVPAHARLNP